MWKIFYITASVFRQPIQSWVAVKQLPIGRWQRLSDLVSNKIKKPITNYDKCEKCELVIPQCQCVQTANIILSGWETVINWQMAEVEWFMWKLLIWLNVHDKWHVIFNSNQLINTKFVWVVFLRGIKWWFWQLNLKVNLKQLSLQRPISAF